MLWGTPDNVSFVKCMRVHSRGTWARCCAGVTWTVHDAVMLHLPGPGTVPPDRAGRETAGGGRHRGRPSEKSHCLDFCHKPREYLISFISGVFIIIQISFSINWSGISEAIMQKLKASQMRWIIHEGQLHFIPGVLPNFPPTPRLLQMTAFLPSLPPSVPLERAGRGEPGQRGDCSAAARR